MNKLKEELLKTAGNVTKHKQRVIVAVERSLEEEPPKRKAPKWMPAVVVTFVLIAFIMISPKLLQQEQQTAAKFATFDEELFDLGVQRYMAYEWTEDDAIDSMNSFYTDYLLYETYAKHHDIRVTKDDLERAEDKAADSQMHEEIEAVIIAYFENNGLSKKDYEKLKSKLLIKEAALEAKLLEPIAAKYPSFDEYAHQFLLDLQVHEFFEQQYTDDYYQFLETYEVDSPLYGYSSDLGVVLLENEEAILFLSAENAELFEDTLPIRWAPKRDGWDVEEGDVIVAYYNTMNNVDEESASYPNQVHVATMRVEEDRTARFEVSKEKLVQYMDTLAWEETTIERRIKPDYVVTDNVRAINGYVTEDRKQVVWAHDGKEVVLLLSDTLETLLQMSEQK